MASRGDNSSSNDDGDDPWDDRAAPGRHPEGQGLPKDDGIPDESEINRRIFEITGAVALKILTPAQAKVMLDGYRELKNVRRSDGATALIDDARLGLLADNPMALQLLAPFLTPAQSRRLVEGRIDADRQG